MKISENRLVAQMNKKSKNLKYINDSPVKMPYVHPSVLTLTIHLTP